MRYAIDTEVKFGSSTGTSTPARTRCSGPEQALLVPRGTRHRTRAPERTVVLMTEAASVVPTGDEPGSRP